MPKYSYVCDECKAQVDILRRWPIEPFLCAECIGGIMVRAAGVASSRIVEVLDNGLMTRRVERPANAEQLYKDRARDSEIDKHKL